MRWVLAAGAWGFAEATLFFIVPDVLLTWIAAFRPARTLPAIGACLLGALLGGALMFTAATRDPAGTRQLVERVPAIGTELVDRTGRGLDASYPRQMLVGGLSGVPYKVLAIEAAAEDGSLAKFLGWSVPARLPRWLALAFLARTVARVARGRFRNADRGLVATWAVAWSLVYAVYFTVMKG